MPIAVIFDYNRTVYDPETDAPVAGAMETLTLLRDAGVTMFLIAKGDEERRKQIDRLGFAPFFKTITVNEKKSSDDYRACMEQCEEGTVWFAVGDRVKEEIRHANACGMTTIWFKSGKFAKEEPADDAERPAHTVTALADAAAIILHCA